MTEAFMDGHMERPTDTLQRPDTKKQIEAMFDASYLIEKGQYGQGGKLLLEILKSQNNNQPAGSYSSFLLQVKFNIMLTNLYSAREYPVSMNKLMENFVAACDQLLKQIQTHEETYFDQQNESEWPFANYLRIRIYTSLIQLSIKSGQANESEWLDELIELLQDDGQKYLPEVLGKLCGCKDLKNFCLNFNYDQFLENQQYQPTDKRKTPTQIAKTIDLASTWFIIGSELKKGIQLKQKAIILWKQANSLKQHDRCEIQYMELKTNTNSEFCTRLKRLAKVIAKIQNAIEQPSKPTKKQQKQMSIIVKKGFGKTMKTIEEFNDELDKRQEEINKANKKKSVWSSSKKQTTISTKKSLLNNSKFLDYYSKAHEFRTECYAKEKNEEITSLLENSSKFILEQQKIISKAIVKMIKMYTRRRKWAFLTLKNYYIIKQAILNKGFLNALPLKKSPEKKNSSASKSNASPQKKSIGDDSEVKPFESNVFNTFAGTGKFASFKKTD